MQTSGSTTRSCERCRLLDMGWTSGLSAMDAFKIRIERLPSGSMDKTTRGPHDAILHAWWMEPGRLLANAGCAHGGEGSAEGATTHRRGSGHGHRPHDARRSPRTV